jgi:hypothetical protein
VALHADTRFARYCAAVFDFLYRKQAHAGKDKEAA